MSRAKISQCNRCVFWIEDMKLRDSADEDFGFGACRVKPPVLIDSLVAAQIERPSWGRGEVPDEIIGTIDLYRATRWPVTFATDICSNFRVKV